MNKKITRSVEEFVQELMVANKALAQQASEKADRAKELVIANLELSFQAAEKADRAIELIALNELLAQELIEKKQQSKSLMTALKNTEKAKADLDRNYLYTKNRMDANLDPFATVSLDGIITDTNSAMMKALGLNKKKILGTRFNTHFTQTERANNLIYLTQRDQKITNYELQLIHSKGESSPFLINASLYKDEDGVPTGIFTSARDISSICKTQQELDFLKSNLEELVAVRLKELEKTQAILKSSLESPKDMIILSLDRDLNYYYFNDKHRQVMLSSYGTQVKIGMNLLEAVSDEGDRIKAAHNYGKALLGESFSTIEEFGLLDKKYFETFYNPILNDIKQIIGATAFYRDITTRKLAEENILYLSYHDQLTGLYNRRFYEEELQRLDTERNLPLSLVMGDVNGLKLINDTFGHAIGDDLLIKIANVFKKVCRSDDIIARLGGDEFMILLPKTDTDKAKAIITRIQEELSDSRDGKIMASVSFGYETKIRSDQDTATLMKKSEDHMYQHKLTERTSQRSLSVELIMKTFLAKNQREMMHSTRVSELSEDLAAHLGLSRDDINQTRITGLMHDIGKIGISENILNLPRSLTQDEWFEIKKHTEIGFRILNASEEFSVIAQDVLQHHERFDGMGYPKGLKGDEISVIARIICIADSYDAMSSDRPYRKAFEHDDIVTLLLDNAGTQFDPDMILVFVDMIGTYRKKNLA